MTVKELKAYLALYQKSAIQTAEIEMHLADLKAEAQRLKDHEGNSVALDSATIRYIDACDAAGIQLDKLKALRDDIKKMIDKIDDQKLHSVLYRRYILGQKWEEVAVSMRLDYRWITRLHGRALQNLIKKIDP